MTTSHVICNLTTHELCVAALAVNEASSDLDLPNDQSLHSFVISPSKNRTQGSPIVLWRMIDTESTAEQLALHVAFSRGDQWSCPTRVDQTLARRCITISNGASAIPVVVTTQEDKGTTYILVHIDDHPQLFIENSCPFRILLGEANSAADDIFQDSQNFFWRCEVESNTASYYTLPSVGNRLPDGQAVEQQPRLLLSGLPQHHDGKTPAGSFFFYLWFQLHGVVHIPTPCHRFLNFFPFRRFFGSFPPGVSL